MCDIIRIVIADDEPNIIELIKRFCDFPYIDVVGEAGNGAETIEILKSTRPDMLITDVRMPGMNGLELIGQVRNFLSDIEIVVISGYRVFDYVKSAIKFGVQDFLLKPIDKSELQKIIHQVMEKRRAKEKQTRLFEDIENNLRTSLIRLRKEWLLKIVKMHIIDGSLMTSELFDNSGNILSCISILKFDYKTDKEHQIPYIKELQTNIGENIAGILRICDFDVLYVYDETRIYFFLSLEENNVSVFRGKIEKAVKPLTDYLNNEKNKYNFLIFHMGFGESVPGINDIIISYKMANQIILNRMDPSMNIVSIYNCKFDAVIKKCLFSIEHRDEISKFAEVLDTRIIIKYFNETIDNYLKNKNGYGWIYEFSIDFVNYLQYIFINKGIIDAEFYPAEYNIEEIIDNCYCIEILKQRIADYISYVVKKIIEFKETHYSRPIRIVQDFVKINYAKQITIQEVSNKVNLSPNYFSTLFRNQVGITFLDYLTKVRMENAKFMLKTSLMNISQIAYSVGYADEKYFSKLFLRMTGVKPTEYRKFHS
jgi:two-component system response regulator YesN